MVSESSETVQRAPAKGRILETATELFYQNGILNVGVDRIIAQSSVTKATFYKHYRSKDNLILEYVKNRRRAGEAVVQSIIDGVASPHAAVLELFSHVSAELTKQNFRGCPFLNVVVEFPNPTHPVRLLISDHRDWYYEALYELMRAAQHPFPGDAADELVLAKDGALAGGCAGDTIAAGAAMSRIVKRVLAESTAA